MESKHKGIIMVAMWLAVGVSIISEEQLMEMM